MEKLAAFLTSDAKWDEVGWNVDFWVEVVGVDLFRASGMEVGYPTSRATLMVVRPGVARFGSDRFARCSGLLASRAGRIAWRSRGARVALACCSDGSVDWQRFVRFVPVCAFFPYFQILITNWKKWKIGLK